MDVCGRVFLFYILLLAITGTAATPTVQMGSDFSSCLSRASGQQHRLEKENTLRNCFQEFKGEISRDLCFQSLAKFKISGSLKENIKSVCFYETTMAKNFNGCMLETKKFNSSYDHDDAIFFCIQQFQDNVTAKDCMGAAEQMVFPLKKQHLVQHCQSDVF